MEHGFIIRYQRYDTFIDASWISRDEKKMTVDEVFEGNGKKNKKKQKRRRKMRRK